MAASTGYIKAATVAAVVYVTMMFSEPGISHRNSDTITLMNGIHFVCTNRVVQIQMRKVTVGEMGVLYQHKRNVPSNQPD
jgi:hypothetical protein